MIKIEKVDSLKLRDNKILINGQDISYFHDRMVFKYKDRFCVIIKYLSKYSKNELKKIVTDIFKIKEIQKICLISFDFEGNLNKLDFLSNLYLAWYLLYNTNGKFKRCVVKKPAAAITFENMTTIPPSLVKEFLIKQWKKDYINPFLRKYPLKFKKQLQNDYLNMLSKETHYIAKLNNDVVGHYAALNEIDKITKQPVLAVHAWANKNFSNTARAYAHKCFFREISRFRGIILAAILSDNKPSLNLFMNNNFKIRFMGLARI